MDNFLFGSVMTHPEYGEKASRILLQTIFQKEFTNLHIVPQKVFYGSDTNLHGARLDVYIESAEDGECIYDIEPDQHGRTAEIAALPQRIRFYHAKIDARSLKAGEEYGKLKRVVIVMILPFDPLGADRMIYTLKQCCLEDNTIPFDDGSTTVLLYINGKQNDASSQLRDLLNYIADSKEKNAVNQDLENLHRIVEDVKHDSEVSISYMNMMEDFERMYEEGREDAIREGREEGLRIGMEEGLKTGREEGLKTGREEGLKTGREEGLKTGREEGLKTGREEGLKTGMEEGLKTARKILEESLRELGHSEEEIQSIMIDKFKQV